MTRTFDEKLRTAFDALAQQRCTTVEVHVAARAEWFEAGREQARERTRRE